MSCRHILQWGISIFDFVKLFVGVDVAFNESFEERVDESVEEARDAGPRDKCVNWFHGERMEGKAPDE
jgi:hypothetical protein